MKRRLDEQGRKLEKSTAHPETERQDGRVQLEEKERTAILRLRLDDFDRELEHLRARMATLTREKQTLLAENRSLNESRVLKLGRVVRNEPLSARTMIRAARLVGAMATPEAVKRHLRPLLARRRPRPNSLDSAADGFQPYRVSVPRHVEPGRRRVVHFIANFMTGGSSQLVVDLVEHLSQHYEQ